MDDEMGNWSLVQDCSKICLDFLIEIKEINK